MSWLGLILPICFVSGYTGASIPTQWAVLSIILPFGLWRSAKMTPMHWAGLAFVAYAFLTLQWTLNFYETGRGLWIVSIWAAMFWLGSTIENLESLWKGLAIGLSISSLVAIVQAFGYSPVLTAGGDPGLLFNTAASGASFCLIIVALIFYRLWFYIPCLLPGFFLSNSRGAFLTLAAVLLSRIHWGMSLALILAVGIIFYFIQGPTDIERLHIWKVAYQYFSLFGVGSGMFADLIYQFHNTTERPEFAHNDAIQLWFEYGLGAIPIYCIFAWTLTRTLSTAWPIFVAFAVLGLFYFPLYCPIPSFIGCIVAGHIARDWAMVRPHSDHGRFNLLSWLAQKRLGMARNGSSDIPLGSRTQNAG